MASLGRNVVISAAAMLLVGLMRPAFNAAVNRAFGPEVNGHAATLIALIFLVSLPATAALPSVMLRHVSMALGAGRTEEARAHARLATWAAVLLSGLSVGAALLYRQRSDAPLAALEAVWVALGVLGYTYWRLYRTLLLAVDRAMLSLKAELASVLGLAVALTAAIVLELPEWALGAFVASYWVFAIFTLPAVVPAVAGGALDDAGRRSFTRYNLLWFIGTASSLAAREIAVLFLDQRVERALVGEISVALSLLMMLAFAPRILELPLVHELSTLGGANAREAQLRLTNKSLHWLTVVTLAGGTGAAILAVPILALVGDVHTPVVAQAFALIALAFMAEMVVTPASNLLAAEASPVVAAAIGAASLVGAFAWWLSPLGAGVLGVIGGLAVSHLIKAVAVGIYASWRFGVALFARPLAKLVAAAAAAVGVAGSLGGDVDPLLAFFAFEALLVSLFFADLKALAIAFLPKRRRA